MIKQRDKEKLEVLKGELELPKKKTRNRIKDELTEAETRINIDECMDVRDTLKTENKKEKKTKSPQLTEDKLKEILDQHFDRVKELVEAQENNICFRVYNSFKAVLRRAGGDIK